MVKIQSKDEKNQLLEIPSQPKGTITIKDSVNLLSENPITTLNPNYLSTTKNIKVVDEFAKELKNVTEVYTDDSSFKNIINIDQWELTQENQLNFETKIDASKFPKSGIYSFEIDVILNNIPEESWWREWNLTPGRDNPNDGSKTQNLLNFMRGLKTITSNLMEDNPPKIGRFCYVIHKK